MNSSFSMLSGSLLEIVSEILDILELLHTVSIEFTVLRENSSILGLDIQIQYLLAEQKQTSKPKDHKTCWETFKKDVETVSANC